MKKYRTVSDSEDRIFEAVLKKPQTFRVIKKYEAENYLICIFEFGDDGIEFIKENCLLYGEKHSFADEKGCIYSVTQNGVSKHTEYRKKYTLSKLKRNIRRNLRTKKYSAFINKTDKRKAKNLKSDSIIKNGFAVWYPSFKRLKFYNHSEGTTHRFRLHIPKNKTNSPLIVFLHGGGSPGYDNFQQMWEVGFAYKRLKKAKKDCFILAPQLGYTEAYNTDEHSEMLWKMINTVNEKYGGIDFSRIYIIGASYGGYGTVYECFRHPDRYAAAIPTVAWIYLENEVPVSSYKFGDDKYHLPFDEDGISELSKTPMWLACSHIELKHAQFLFDKLNDANADVRLTRNDKHGHMMCLDFLKNEHWDDWLFDKTKNSE